MPLHRLFAAALFLLPTVVFSHDFTYGSPVPHISITDRGEMLLDANNEVSYRAWDSMQFAGKVRIIQYIAGRKSAKKKNSMLIKAVKNANFPGELFQPTTIVNTDDEIFGTGFFVLGKIEKNKRNYPWAQFIIDSNGVGRMAWKLNEESSTIIVLNKDGDVQWVKDGALTEQEVNQVITMVRKMIGG